jgi:hypothetical protein
MLSVAQAERERALAERDRRKQEARQRWQEGQQREEEARLAALGEAERAALLAAEERGVSEGGARKLCWGGQRLSTFY